MSTILHQYIKMNTQTEHYTIPNFTSAQHSFLEPGHHTTLAKVLIESLLASRIWLVELELPYLSSTINLHPLRVIAGLLSLASAATAADAHFLLLLKFYCSAETSFSTYVLIAVMSFGLLVVWVYSGSVNETFF